MKHFLRLRDLSREELIQIVNDAISMKKCELQVSLKGKHVALIFEKPSTRTRVSLEVAVSSMEGYPLVLSSRDMQLGRGESISDTARVLSRFVDAIAIRTFEHARVEEFAKWSRVPVINALTDEHHPLQLLADVMTVKEYKGRIEDLCIAYVGDVNNVCNSWIEGAGCFGYRLHIAVPEKYTPSEAHVKDLARGSDVKIFHDPCVACEGADVIATDVWVSMGMEEEKEERLRDFAGFTVDERLVAVASEDVIVLHCLPAYKGYEISEAVFERFAEMIFQEAENRLHTAKAVLKHLLIQ